MRNVIFCAPFAQFPATRRFARALAQLEGVRLLGIFQQPPTGEAQRWFADTAIVADTLDSRQLIAAATRLSAQHGTIFRAVGILENMQDALADVRAHFGLPGPTPATTARFRDKALMKTTLARAGLPVAEHRLLESADDARWFARKHGFPIILKPPAGAGCKATYRCDDPTQLEAALRESQPSKARAVLAEEFLQGSEYSFETICIEGIPRFVSISRYFPGPLEVVRNPHLQWVCLLPRDISGPQWEAARAMGLAAVTRLGMGTGLTHMEWFERPDGRLAIGEIAMRPPGAQIVSLMGWAHDTDMYRAWARAVIDHAFDGPWERKYAVACCYLRGAGRGRIVAVDGLDEAQRAIGSLVVDSKLPEVGAMKSDSYEGDGYAILRHPDTATVAAAARTLIETVRVRYSG